jgi:signal transduction histidine kinase
MKCLIAYSFGMQPVTENKLKQHLPLKRNLIMEEYSQNKEKFNRLIVHELRNPLTSIALANQLLIEALEEDEAPSSLFDLTDIISKNIKRIQNMLKDMLEPKIGQVSRFVSMDLCHVIDDSLNKARDRIFLRNVDVIKDYRPEFVVSCDPEKLSLAFLNIIINSLEALRIERGKLWISIREAADSVKIVFKDNGIGMKPSIASKIFDENFSLKPHGLGIGLALVKQVLDEHNASISVESEPGHGTTTTIEFKNYDPAEQ